MTRKELLSQIVKFLGRFSSEVEIHNNSSEYDINIISEDLLVPLLNLIFDFNLINANRISKNFPAIDLIDTENRVAFQITSTDSTTKLNSTLEKFKKHELEKNIDLLYILSLIHI